MFRSSVTTALPLALAISTFLLAGPTGGESSTPGVDPLAEARLLARYGEAQRAYDLSAGVAPARDAVALDVRLLTEMGRYEAADSLLVANAPLADDVRIFAHHLQRARLRYLLGDFHGSRDLLIAVDSLTHAFLEPFHDYLLVEALTRTGEAERAVAVGSELHERGVPSSLSPDFEFALADAYQEAGRPDDALAIALSMRRRMRGYEQKARQRHLEYELHVRSGRFDEARAAARVLVESYSRYPGSAAAASEVLAQFPPAELKTSELLSYATYLTLSEQRRAAKGVIRELERRKVGASLEERRRLVRAQYYYRAGDYARAASLAKPAFRDPALKRHSVLILARSYRRMGRGLDAARLYEYFARAFANDGKAAEALFVASRIYEKEGRSRDQARTDKKLRQGYPSNYFGRVATLRSARTYTEQGKHQQAANILSARVKRSRRTDEAAMYYLAGAYAAMGKHEQHDYFLEQIATVDPYSFYLSPDFADMYSQPVVTSTGELLLSGSAGLVSFLSISSERKSAAYGRVRAALVGDDAAAAGVTDCIERGRWFLDVGFRDWGEQELEQARRKCYNSAASMLELAWVYDEYAMPWRSLRLYQHVKDRLHWRARREYADELRWLMYPTPFPVQVLENAARYDLPPHLVYAMIREESRFETAAVSRVGALGLMQLMPETGRFVARELELPEWVDDDLLDPEINLMFGIWYAASLLESSRGNTHRMLAAYNAGPGNARRWFDEASRGSIVEAVDGIDFKETRGYVRRIVESANVYHSLYFSGEPVETTQ